MGTTTTGGSQPAGAGSCTIAQMRTGDEHGADTQLPSRRGGPPARFLAALVHSSAYSSLTPGCRAAPCQRWPGALWEGEEVAELLGALRAPAVPNQWVLKNPTL